MTPTNKQQSLHKKMSLRRLNKSFLVHKIYFYFQWFELGSWKIHQISCLITLGTLQSGASLISLSFFFFFFKIYKFKALKNALMSQNMLKRKAYFIFLMALVWTDITASRHLKHYKLIVVIQWHKLMHAAQACIYTCILKKTQLLCIFTIHTSICTSFRASTSKRSSALRSSL